MRFYNGMLRYRLHGALPFRYANFFVIRLYRPHKRWGRIGKGRDCYLAAIRIGSAYASARSQEVLRSQGPPPSPPWPWPTRFGPRTSDPTNLFGSRGVIATPSARMAPDGELSVGAGFLKNNQHYNFGFQVLPWLEASFRYSGLQHFHGTIRSITTAPSA